VVAFGRQRRVSLFTDIGQGAGLAGASGVRPFLPPLLAGALARGDAGIDFSGSGWEFLESPGFLLAVLALAVISYGAERSGANRRGDRGAVPLAERPGRAGRPQLAMGLAALGAALGALLFAGSLAEGGEAAWPGLIAGVACAMLAWVAVGGLFERARGRLEGGAAGLITAYADAAALVLAAIAVFVPPVSYAALAAFVVLLLRGRAREDRKYAGLRILR
jgi:hypothetical protein